LDVTYSQRERFWLWALGVTGFLVVNGAFLYGLLLEPEAMEIAMRNPVSLAFMIEALLLLGAFAYLLPRWGVSRLSATWFILLSLLGSMAFALPIVLLWGRQRRRSAEGREPSPGLREA
jgi:hypothetical protein